MKTYRNLIYIILCLSVLRDLEAAEQPRLRPVEANFQQMVPGANQKAPSQCELALIAAPPPLKPSVTSLVVVGTKPYDQNKTTTEMFAVQFDGDAERGRAPSVTNSYRWAMKTFQSSDLLDTINSDVKTGGFLKSLLSSDKIAVGSSIVVSKDALVDTSLLIDRKSTRLN